MKPVERTEVEGVDYGWVMQTTFVVTIVVGAPIVAALSTLVTLETWGARVAFAIRVGAPIWFLTAVATALYAKRTGAGDGDADLGVPEGNDDVIETAGHGDTNGTAGHDDANGTAGHDDANGTAGHDDVAINDDRVAAERGDGGSDDP